MKRAIWIIAILLISIFFVNSYLENRVKEEAKKAEAERIEKTINAALDQLAGKTNAVHNWEKELSNKEQFRLRPILTIELERLWLTDRPILFIGSIKNISTIDQDNYRIRIERDSFRNIAYMFETELQLELQCPKQRVDSFLKNHPDLFEGFGLKNEVAVIADIDEIGTMIVSDSECEKEEIKIGKGKCIDMLYTGGLN